MKLGSLAEDVAPRTGKIIKNQLSVFETGENRIGKVKITQRKTRLF